MFIHPYKVIHSLSIITLSNQTMQLIWYIFDFMIHVLKDYEKVFSILQFKSKI